MKIRTVFLMAVILTICSTGIFLPDANAGGYYGGHGGYYGGHGGYYGGGWHGGGWHGGTSWNFGVNLGGWGWGGPFYPYYGYPYAYPYPYYPAYPYVSAPIVTQQPAQEYQQTAPPPEQQSYWYFCTDPNGYYPYVKRCPSGWLKVVPSGAPSDY